MTHRIAVIGAGLSGLACAQELSRSGFDVTVFEKSRGPGGRCSTRWTDRESTPPMGFDHGAQYFHVRSKSFRDCIEQAAKAQAVAVWSGRLVNLAYGEAMPTEDVEPRWVGTPGMASLGRFLAADLRVEYNTRVTQVELTATGYRLSLQNAAEATVTEDFDWVISAMPCEQVSQLFATHPSRLALEAGKVQSNVTWTCMLSFSQALPVEFDGAFVFDSPVGWACRDSSKPSRAEGERWVIQATAQWSALHAQTPAEEVTEMLIDACRSAFGLSFLADRAVAHRWLYSLPADPLDCNHWIDPLNKLAACGDWLSKGRIEDAFLSGQSLGAEVRSILLK